MEKIIINNNLALGDNVVLTGAIRDLCRTHPNKYEIGIRSFFPEVYKFNPYISNITSGKLITPNYNSALINSNIKSESMLMGYRNSLSELLGVNITSNQGCGSLYLSNKELEMKPVIPKKYWILNLGYKKDATVKSWNIEKAQEVVDYFKDEILFVQVGDKTHNQIPLAGTINLIGKTTIRDLILLVYHSEGVICPITSCMHIAAALPINPLQNYKKPVIVIAGGREPPHFTAYDSHTFLHTIGCLDCCSTGGCWKSRVVPLNDNTEYDNRICKYPIKIKNDYIPKCMNLINSIDIISAIERYENINI